MEVTLLGMIVFLQPAIRVLSWVCMIALQLFRESYTVFPSVTTIDVRLEQPSNALTPKEVTLFGMVISVRLEQPRNAPSPMDVTLFGMVMLVRLVQL